mgnify:CR=1 FL=1
MEVLGKRVGDAILKMSPGVQYKRVITSLKKFESESTDVDKSDVQQNEMSGADENIQREQTQEEIELTTDQNNDGDGHSWTQGVHAAPQRFKD